jgi:hypothetical protein
MIVAPGLEKLENIPPWLVRLELGSDNSFTPHAMLIPPWLGLQNLVFDNGTPHQDELIDTVVEASSYVYYSLHLAHVGPVYIFHAVSFTR